MKRRIQATPARKLRKLKMVKPAKPAAIVQPLPAIDDSYMMYGEDRQKKHA